MTHLLQGVVRQPDLALMQVAIDKGNPVMFAIKKTDCIPVEERGDLVAAYHRRLTSEDPEVCAAKGWRGGCLHVWECVGRVWE